MQNYQHNRHQKFYELMEYKEIRSLSEKFAKIHSKSFNQKNLKYSSDFILSLLKNPNISYIYKKNKGFCIFSCNEKEAEIITMAILPKYQNQGIGFLILKELEGILSKISCNKVFLEVASNNLIAIHLYDKLGFKSFGIRKNYYSVSENKKVNAILMKKII